MGKNEPNVVRRAVKTVAENLNVKKAARTLDRIVDEEAPRPESSPKAELAVVAPTPLSGGCSLRLIEAAGFGGVVVATLAAALVGRCRR